MIIKNADFDQNCFSIDDLYIFTVGYEHRSYYLYDLIVSMFPSIAPMVFAFDDYTKYPHTRKKIEEITSGPGQVSINNYANSQAIQQGILDAVRKRLSESDSVTIHIDYSAMPRSWYCKLPTLLEKVIRETDTIYFWYSEGEYPPSYEEYPSAGIDSFSLFSGKPSLQVDSNRIHVLGLGYDVIRSQAIISITDPDYLIVCYAYNPKREGFLDSLNIVNDPIISQAAMTIALHLNDFEFMVSKLCETANELLPLGDVILIPDGPKPLIFAFSLVPELLKKSGLTCLHISRNSEYFETIDVKSTGIVHGFSMQTFHSGLPTPPSSLSHSDYR